MMVEDKGGETTLSGSSSSLGLELAWLLFIEADSLESFFFFLFFCLVSFVVVGSRSESKIVFDLR